MKLWFTFILTAGLACAQQNPAPAAPPARHESIVVTGTAEPTPLDEADRDVIALPLNEKQRLLFDNWFGLLQLDPALDLQQRSPGGFIADLSIRGASYGQTLVLLNGIRLNDVQTGHFHLDLPVPLDSVSSLEVLKGSGSTLYGADAIGGVVNVRTQPFEAPDFRIMTGAGNFGTNEQHLLTSFGGPKFSEELALARDFSSGFTANRDYRNLAISSLSSFKKKLGSGSALFAYSDRPFGADQFYGNYPSWERTKSWFGSLHQNLGDKTEVNLAYRRHTDLFVLFRYSPQIYLNRHIDDEWQGSLRRHDNLPLHAVISYGAEGLADSISSTNLGLHDRRRGSGYVFYDIRSAKRFSLSAGIREEAYGSGQHATSPSLSAAAWFSSRFKLRASASRGFRLPTYTDLYYSDPANKGNPNLKPESATNYEGGLDAYLRPNLHASVTVFHRRDSNEIDYVRATPADLWQATNFDKLHFTGVEALTAWEPVAGQQVSVSFAALRGVAATPGVLLSKYAFNYPVHSATLQWNSSFAGRFIARLRLGIMDRLGRDAYAVWDASLGYAAGRVRPFLQLTNITSTGYEEIPSIAMPKAGVLGGLEIILAGSRR